MTLGCQYHVTFTLQYYKSANLFHTCSATTNSYVECDVSFFLAQNYEQISIFSVKKIKLVASCGKAFHIIFENRFKTLTMIYMIKVYITSHKNNANNTCNENLTQLMSVWQKKKLKKLCKYKCFMHKKNINLIKTQLTFLSTKEKLNNCIDFVLIFVSFQCQVLCHNTFWSITCFGCKSFIVSLL